MLTDGGTQRDVDPCFMTHLSELQSRDDDRSSFQAADQWFVDYHF